MINIIINMTVVLLICSALVIGKSSSTPILTETLSVRQVNEDGFGNINNQYAFSMEEFKGDLYVGTLNAIDPYPISMMAFFLSLPFPTNGTEIWRGRMEKTGDWTWQKAIGSGGPNNEDNFGVRKLKSIGDWLYGVTANHKTGFEVWRTLDGDDWEVVASGGFGDVENTSGRGLGTFNGYLYVGCENRKTGAKMWRRKITADGDFDEDMDWEEVITDGLGKKYNYWFSDIVEFNGYKYVGTLNPFGMNLYRTQNDMWYEPVFEGGNGNRFEMAVMKLFVYNDQLYFGTMNFAQGASLYRSTNSEGTKFETVFTRGNGNRLNSYVWYLEEFKNRLYIGTFKSFGEFELYSAVDPGKQIDVETKNAFGFETHFGIRTMAVYNNKLMIGTATSKDESACKVLEASRKVMSSSALSPFAPAFQQMFEFGEETEPNDGWEISNLFGTDEWSRKDVGIIGFYVVTGWMCLAGGVLIGEWLKRRNKSRHDDNMELVGKDLDDDEDDV